MEITMIEICTILPAYLNLQNSFYEKVLVHASIFVDAYFSFWTAYYQVAKSFI